MMSRVDAGVEGFGERVSVWIVVRRDVRVGSGYVRVGVLGDSGVNAPDAFMDVVIDVVIDVFMGLGSMLSVNPSEDILSMRG
jgi:hypothetical protein